MKRFVATLLTLAMILAATAALAVPAKSSLIEGLPEMPEVPSMTTKTIGKTQYVYIDGELSDAHVWRNWWWDGDLVFEDGVATFDRSGEAMQPGVGCWGNYSENGRFKVDKSFKSTPVEVSSWYDHYEYDEKKDEWVGVGYQGSQRYWEEAIGPDAKGQYWAEYHLGWFGWSDIGWAYDGITPDGVHVYYDDFGAVKMIELEMEGTEFLENGASTKTVITWQPLNTWHQYSWNFYISNITEEYEDGSVCSADFSGSLGGKLLHVETATAE